MTNEKWQPCPRCGSNKVENRSGCLFFILGIGLISLFFWVMLFIPVIGVLGIGVGLIVMIISPFKKGMLQCQDCKNTWKYNIESSIKGPE